MMGWGAGTTKEGIYTTEGKCDGKIKRAVLTLVLTCRFFCLLKEENIKCVYEREYETGQVKNCVQEHKNTVEHNA